MVISFSLSPAPTITDKIAVVIYKADSNGQPTLPAVASQEFAPPHTSPRNISFTGVEPVPHIVNTYVTSGLPLLGSLQHSFLYNPEFSDLEIKVQYLTFNAGDVTYDVPDTSWDGYKVLHIDRAGTGPQVLTRITDAQPHPDATLRVRDADTDNPKGFDLIAPGDSAFQDERFIVTLVTRITSRLPIYQVAKVIRDSILFNNDGAVTEQDANKDIILAGDSNVFAFTISLPTIGSFSNFNTFFFNSMGGAHINVTLDAGADKIFIYNFFNTTGYRNKVHLGQQEQFAIYNNADGWHVVHNCTGILSVGQHVESYSRNYPNVIFMDGALLQRNTDRRLFEYFTSPLYNGTMVSEAAWNGTATNYKAYPSTGDGLSTFRLPQVYSAGFPEPIAATGRQAGNFAPFAMQQHQHVVGYDSDASSTNTSPFGVAPLGMTAKIGKFTGTFTSIPDLTGGAYTLQNNIYVPSNTGDKVRPDSYGVYKSIRR